MKTGLPEQTYLIFSKISAQYVQQLFINVKHKARLKFGSVTAFIEVMNKKHGFNFTESFFSSAAAGERFDISFFVANAICKELEIDYIDAQRMTLNDKSIKYKRRRKKNIRKAYLRH